MNSGALAAPNGHGRLPGTSRSCLGACSVHAIQPQPEHFFSSAAPQASQKRSPSRVAQPQLPHFMVHTPLTGTGRMSVYRRPWNRRQPFEWHAMGTDSRHGGTSIPVSTIAVTGRQD